MTRHVGMPFLSSNHNVARTFERNSAHTFVEGDIVSLDSNGGFVLFDGSKPIFGIIAFSNIALETHYTVFLSGSINVRLQANDDYLEKLIERLDESGRGFFEGVIDGVSTHHRTGLTYTVDVPCARVTLY